MYSPKSRRDHRAATPWVRALSRESSSSISTGRTSLPDAFSERSSSLGSFHHFPTSRTALNPLPGHGSQGPIWLLWQGGPQHSHSTWVGTTGLSPEPLQPLHFPGPAHGRAGLSQGLLESPSTALSPASAGPALQPFPGRGAPTRERSGGLAGPEAVTRQWRRRSRNCSDPAEQRLCWSCTWGHVCPSHGKCQLGTSLGRLGRGTCPAQEQPQEEAMAEIYQQDH